MLMGDGTATIVKAKIVEAHRPGKGPRFIQVEMSEMKIVAHECAAVVTCAGAYAAAETTFRPRFMWVRKAAGWRIVAGAVANEK